MERELTVKEALDFAVSKQKDGLLSEAKEIYEWVLKIFPSNSNALHLLGLVLHKEGNSKKAIELIEKAVSINPEAVYYGNLGMIYDSLGKDEESVKFFLKALEINPSYENAYLAHYNLGVYFKEEEDIEKAIKHYRKSIELEPDFAESHWNLSLLLLLTGDFSEGWKEYSYRFKKASPTDLRDFKKPEWDGSSLEGKRILVVSEQGFGDCIQFLRYLPFVKEKGGKIIFECKKELKNLFQPLNWVDEFVDKENIFNSDFDFYIHLMDLPRIFGFDENNGSLNVPYLNADRDLVKKFSEKMKTSDFKVGIVWAGNPNQDEDKNRSASFENFKVLSEIEGVALFSLQKGKAANQLGENSKVVDLSGEINDFSDTAAIIENLDLVISVDTSVAHLSGAMGKSTWTLLTIVPDWRWLLETDKSLWYGTMKLFRQKKKGDWKGVMDEVEEKLRQKVV